MINYNLLPIASSAKYLLTDSRTVLFPNESIFFAIRGLNHDGHQYIKDLYYIGVRDFVIEEASINDAFSNSIVSLNEANFWKVPNAIIALQDFVAKKRAQFNLPVIAITGSNGKTIIKEWLAQMLAHEYNIIKSPKSYNSQLGVPLSVWPINLNHTLGIFEAGISQPNEMQNLAKVIMPKIGVFTNIGTAHDEFFESKNQKIKEKLKLFVNVEALIFSRDNEDILDEVNLGFKNVNPNCNLISWSLKDTSPFSFSVKSDKIVFFDGDTYAEYILPFQDAASIQNLCHCIVVLNYLKFDNAFINRQMQNLKPVAMRLELKEGLHNSYLIDDSYNNDFIGLKLAIEFLNQQRQHSSKVLILSDMLQTGENENTLYKNIASLIAINKIDQLIGVGPKISKNADLFSKNSIFFQNTDVFLQNLGKISLQNSVILIKGARSFSFEKIVNLLQAKNHETYLEINLDAVIHNLNYYKHKLKPNAKIMAMVKAFAYGAGNKEIASIMQFQGVDYLGVAYTDEGVFLRQNGISLPIMVMNPTINDFNKLIEYSLEPEIYSIQKLEKLVEFVDEYNGFVKIHLKFDTGMHRLGFELSQITALKSILSNNPNLVVASMFTHLAGSDTAELDGFTKQQANQFITITNEISQAIGYKPIRHILNSAGISRFPEYHFEMVRLGVGLYGVGASANENEALMTVGTLKTAISQIKEIDQNETVGYGRKGIINRKTKIATIAIGYADGYRRQFGNGKGKINVNGILCPTIGNICMDMTMIDITGVKANEGDEVIIFGQNPTVYQLARDCGTIPYEILTNIGERVKRVFYKV